MIKTLNTIKVLYITGVLGLAIVLYFVTEIKTTIVDKCCSEKLCVYVKKTEINKLNITRINIYYTFQHGYYKKKYKVMCIPYNYVPSIYTNTDTINISINAK